MFDYIHISSVVCDFKVPVGGQGYLSTAGTRNVTGAGLLLIIKDSTDGNNMVNLIICDSSVCFSQ